MTSDLVSWAGDPSAGAGGGELLNHSAPPPRLPDPRENVPRSRPNRGRKRKHIGIFLAEPPWDLLRATGYPIPPDVTCLSQIPAQWRAGDKWRKWRDGVFAMWGSECHLCHHPHADSADHLVPLAMWGNQPFDPRLSRPAHGVSGCPVCHLKCNSSRGHKQYAKQIANYQGAIRL